MPKQRPRLRDWLVGGSGKRRLLEALLLGDAPPEGWTETELARRSAMRREGSVDEPLAALGQLGVVTRQNARYKLATRSPLVEPLARLLHAMRDLPDTEVKRASEWKRSS